MQDLTPSQIVAELDKYIVGQSAAKRAVAIALRNRYRRRQLPEDLRDEVIPKNILMIGPTGVGKTEIARRLANLAHAPFIKIEATKFTEVGYVGRDVESMIRDLVQVSLRLVEQERVALVSEEAEQRAVDRIVDILQPRRATSEERDSAEVFRATFGSLFGGGSAVPEPEAEEAKTESDDEQKQRERQERIRKRLRDDIISGKRDEQKIDIEVEAGNPQAFVQFFSPQGVEEMGMNDLQNAFGNILNRGNSGKKQRSLTIKEAKTLLAQEEARGLIDHDSVVREAVDRAEQTGIIFLDELDKIAGKEGGSGPDVSREGVQRDLLPIIEGSTVSTKYGPVKTEHILFIGAGAFHVSKPSDLIPELQGRLPIRVELESLTEADLKRILTEPKNALVRQYIALLGTEGVTLEFTDDSIDEISAIAARVNTQSENIGARRLHTVLERLLEEVSFGAPDHAPKEVVVDAGYVRERLENVVADEDLSRYIL